MQKYKTRQRWRVSSFWGKMKGWDLTKNTGISNVNSENIPVYAWSEILLCPLAEKNYLYL